MIRLDLLRPALERDLARLVDDDAEEELEGFGCSVRFVPSISFHIVSYLKNPRTQESKQAVIVSLHIRETDGYYETHI